jgi:hypothetical protein
VKALGELASTLVRPLVTLLLVGAQVVLGVAWAHGWENAAAAFAGLGTFTMFVLVFYFKERSDQRNADRLARPLTNSTAPPDG